MRPSPETGSVITDRDLPIASAAEDKLNRQPIVENLLAILTREHPSVVALVAPFGDGKTSIFRLLEEQFQVRFKNKFTIVNFSSWLPPSPEALILTLFESVMETLRVRFYLPYVSEETLEYGRVITGSVPHLQWLKDLFRESSQSARLSRLAKYISDLPTRVIVLIDDVDRMGFAEMEALFKAIRGISDVSNVSFVCAFEMDAVVEQVKKSRSTEHAARYLEKFFPIQVLLPKVESESLKRLFADELSALAVSLEFVEKCDRAFDDRIDKLWDAAVGGYISNLRRLKLFINKLKNMLPSIAGEVDFVDFVALEAVRDISPETYNLVFQRANFFAQTGWAIETWGQTHPDRDTAKKQRADFYQKNLGDAQGAVVALLSQLFPYVDEWKRSGGFSFGMYYGEQAEAEKDKRICHPRFFKQYFVMRVPEDYLSQKERRDFRLALDKAQSAEDAERLFVKTYESILSTIIKRWQFFKFVQELASAQDHQAEGLAMGAAKVARHLTADAFEWENALNTILNAARAAGPGATRLVLRAMSETESDAFVVFIHARFNDDKQPELQDIVDVEQLKNAMLHRFRKKYIDQSSSSSIFELPDDTVVRIIFPWARWGGDADIAQLLQRELANRPARAINILHLIFPRAFIIDANAWKRFIDFRELYERLLQLQQNGGLTASRDMEDLGSLREQVEAQPAAQELPDFGEKLPGEGLLNDTLSL